MFHDAPRPLTRFILVAGSALTLAACEPGLGLDADLRGGAGAFSTTPAAKSAAATLPRPDARGIITYPNYQVAIARRGDKLTDVAARIGMDAPTLAKYNGIARNVTLRDGEVIALPSKVATGLPTAAAPVDITTLAGNAINNAPDSPAVSTSTLPAAKKPAKAAPTQKVGSEPIRHKVRRGETAYIIARLYDIPIRTLASYNNLGSDFAIREGQFLLIPTDPAQLAAARKAPAPTTEPGVGSPTPKPPSSVKPLPAEKVPSAVRKSDAAKLPPKPAASAKPIAKPAEGKLAMPVTGSIIREYSKGRNDGIDIKAAPGTPVKAADAGTVAAITASADKVPIIVVRHPGNLLTVYANVTGTTVKKGDKVKRGQTLAKLRSGSDAYVHFEVRKGFDSVDPMPYIQ